MCKIWNIIYDCRHRYNATLSTCSGHRKYPNSTSQACMQYYTLRLRIPGNCGPCRKIATDKRFDHEAKVIEDYFTNISPEELHHHENVDAERTTMLSELERRREEATKDLPTGDSMRGSKYNTPKRKFDYSHRPWESRRRATWRLSPLANEVLPEYIEEPLPDWAFIFGNEESDSEREKREEAERLAAVGIVDWEAEVAKDSEADTADSERIINDWTESRDVEFDLMDEIREDMKAEMEKNGTFDYGNSESGSDLDECDQEDEASCRYKDLDQDMEDHLTSPDYDADWMVEEDDSGFVSDDSIDDANASEEEKLYSMNTSDFDDPMDWSTTAEYANFHSEARELNTSCDECFGPLEPLSDHISAPWSYPPSIDSTQHTPSDASTPSTSTDTFTGQPTSNDTTHQLQDNTSTEQPFTIPSPTAVAKKETTSCLMEVEGVKYLIGDRQEQAQSWQWSTSPLKKTKGHGNLIIRW